MGLFRRLDSNQKIRCGLCPGSADLIGWRSITITPDMVGNRVAQFVAIEVKTPAGRVSQPQVHFLDRVKSAGGHALVVRSEDDL